MTNFYDDPDDLTPIDDLPVLVITGPVTVDKAGEFSHVHPHEVTLKVWDDGAKALVVTGHAARPADLGGSHPMKHVVYLPRDDAARAEFLDALIRAAKAAV